MKLLIKLTLVSSMAMLLVVVTLWPTQAMPPSTFSDLEVSQGSQESYRVRAQPVLTFTPVATIYLPAVANKPVPPPDVKIVHIEYDPASGTDAEGEYVEIKNLESTALEMMDWTLRDEANAVFTFPEFTLASQATVRVWVKDGVDDASNLYWGRGSAVWNNGGDTAILRNSNGAEVDSCSYPGGDPGFTECE